MPEYLSPGVYIEETSFRSKSIEGVSTSTAAFVGPTTWGPISGEPQLVTSLADFERIYGSFDNLNFGGTVQPNYMAHAVRAFFEEGGSRLYISRIFSYDGGKYLPDDTNPNLPKNHYAKAIQSDQSKANGAPPPDPKTPAPFSLVARFPGSAGNMRVTFQLRTGNNVYKNPGAPMLVRVQAPEVVALPVSGGSASLKLAKQDNTSKWVLVDDKGSAPLPADKTTTVLPLTVQVLVERPIGDGAAFNPPEFLGEYDLDPRSSSALTSTFTRNPADSLGALTTPFSLELTTQDPPDQQALSLANTIFGADVIGKIGTQGVTAADLRQTFTLEGGNDGVLPVLGSYEGDPAFEDYLQQPLQMAKNGLMALEGIDDISIVAAPGATASYNTKDQNSMDNVHAIVSALIAHCEKLRYRIAVLDTPPNMLVNDALDFRNEFSSTYAAIYYPWVVIENPDGSGRLKLPPSPFIAGIYARNDDEHAVFKAPANEVIRLAIDFEHKINKAQQDILNPNGINCLRFFEGRGYRVWGARTITDDSEWKYVNLRRYFAYLEHSIDRGTQWAVFENNSQPLWSNIKQTISDFLLNEWKMGALMGSKPDSAFFVRCDLSTMTQNDLDNGRLVCLVGVAPVRPAEFVIFRIGQITASS